MKAVRNSGDLDCTYHYYYDQDSMVETRNGSGQVIKQHVWGVQYVDELVQVAVNSDPLEDDECNLRRWVLLDANWNVLGVVEWLGQLVERYEYTPYGERVVYRRTHWSQADLHAPTLSSRRVKFGSVDQPYGICDIGHQGLMHDEETGLVYNRARMLHPRLGRFIQRDPLGYVDGMGLYEYVRSNPVTRFDPTGEWSKTKPPIPAVCTLDTTWTANWSITYVGAIMWGYTWVEFDAYGFDTAGCAFFIKGHGKQWDDWGGALGCGHFKFSFKHEGASAPVWPMKEDDQITQITLGGSVSKLGLHASDSAAGNYFSARSWFETGGLNIWVLMNAATAPVQEIWYRVNPPPVPPPPPPANP